MAKTATKTKKKTEEAPIDLSVCRICGKEIMVQCYQHTGFCSNNCIKISRGEPVVTHELSAAEAEPAPVKDESTSEVITDTE